MLFDRISDASLTRLRVLGRESVVVVALYCLGYDERDQETEDGEAEDDTTLMNKQKKLSESRKYHILYIEIEFKRFFIPSRRFELFR